MTGRVPMDNPAESRLTVEERAEVMHIQERMMNLFVDRGEALELGNTAQADALQREIDDLLRERDDIKAWASAK